MRELARRARARRERARRERARESVQGESVQAESTQGETLLMGQTQKAVNACAWWKLTSLKLKDLSHILVRNNHNSAVEVEVKVRVDTLEAQLDFHRLVTFLPQ